MLRKQHVPRKHSGITFEVRSRSKSWVTHEPLDHVSAYVVQKMAVTWRCLKMVDVLASVVRVPVFAGVL